MPDIRVCQAACGTTPHPGSKPVVCLPASGHPRPPSVAISMGTAPMIAIPGAAFMGSVAMIVGSTRQVCCNHFGHGRPMIAIPPADVCGSLTYGDLQRYRIGDGRMWLIPARCYYDCLNRLKEHGITIYATAEDVASFPTPASVLG